ncbi:MAG TPA: phospholipase D-like domain-containing protein [Pyrinomonadaceae bacterium]|nr:phospholipase D-like domain-containing protein [Pyrinomonadaceae bacterium]
MDKALKSAKSGHAIHAATVKEGLTVKGYRGDGSAMLAFDIDEKLCQDLAGFSIKRTAPDGKSCYLPNFLSFTSGVHADTKTEDLGGHPSNEAPFQKFRWVDVVEDVQDGKYNYEVTAMYFADGGKLKAGPAVKVSIEIMPTRFGNFEYGFTRGYLSSQAYKQLFKNAPIRPATKAIDYKTASYQKQYEWLGFHAHKLVFDFLDECVKDKSITVDLFAYDLDEPDFMRGLQKLGHRLRAFLDDAPLHTKPGALEIQAHKILCKSAGAANVKQGHFHRFAHNKVMIMKKNGKPVKVLTGSANFSVRGLYVQANNILVFEDAQTAELYEEAFEQSFNDETKFSSSAIAEGWHDVEDPGLPRFSVCFSPHKTATISLQKVADAIKKASSSVIFAVMELSGGGTVMDELKTEAKEKNIFSYGMTQTAGGIKVYKPGHANAMIVPFAYLKGKVPPPFQDEYSGGAGMVIHDKFVVVDFNGTNPVVFTGSSNLASGGEEANGDNLIAIYDPSVATAYGIEAIRLVDHYHFRAAMKQTDAAKPMLLQPKDAKEKWWQPYYDQDDILYRERMLFSR